MDRDDQLGELRDKLSPQLADVMILFTRFSELYDFLLHDVFYLTINYNLVIIQIYDQVR